MLAGIPIEVVFTKVAQHGADILVHLSILFRTFHLLMEGRYLQEMVFHKIKWLTLQRTQEVATEYLLGYFVENQVVDDGQQIASAWNPDDDVSRQAAV